MNHITDSYEVRLNLVKEVSKALIGRIKSQYLQ